MDHPSDRLAADEDPSRSDGAAIRAMLEQSRRDVAEGRTVAMQPVLDRMRASAKAIRRGRAETSGPDPRRA